jgi:hypothetical protein
MNFERVYNNLQKKAAIGSAKKSELLAIAEGRSHKIGDYSVSPRSANAELKRRAFLKSRRRAVRTINRVFEGLV